MKVIGVALGTMLILPSLVAFKVCLMGLVFALLAIYMLPVMLVVSALLWYTLFLQFRDCNEFLTGKISNFRMWELGGYVIGFIAGIFVVGYVLSERLEFWDPDYQFLTAGLLLQLTSVFIPLAKRLALARRSSAAQQFAAVDPQTQRPL